MVSGHKLPEVKVKRAIELLKSGLPGKIICARLGMGFPKLKKIAKKHGLEIKRQIWNLTHVYEDLQGRRRNGKGHHGGIG